MYNVHLFGNSLPYWFQWVALLHYQDRKRLAAIANQLLTETADVVGLVEIWDDSMARELCTSVCDQYPHSWRVQPSQAHPWKIGTGLLFLSRHPLHDQEFIQFTDHVNGEQYFAEKGVAIVTAVPSGENALPVRVLLTHTQSGILPRDRLARAKDFRTIARLLNRSNNVFTVIMGDFNTLSDEDDLYEYLQATDMCEACTDPGEFVDTYDSVANVTVCKFYPILRLFPHRCRFDRILYRRPLGDAGALQPQTFSVDRGADQYRFSKDAFPCSDHWPVRAEFQYVGGNTDESL